MTRRSDPLPDNEIDSLARDYADWREIDRRRPGAAEHRKALLDIAETLKVAAACLREAFAASAHGKETALNSAWSAINAAAMLNNICQPRSAANSTADALDAWALAATREYDRQRGATPKTRIQTARLVVARELWNKRSSLNLSCSTSRDGNTVSDLLKIARRAGDRSLTTDAAQKSIKTIRPRLPLGKTL